MVKSSEKQIQIWENKSIIYATESKNYGTVPHLDLGVVLPSANS